MILGLIALAVGGVGGFLMGRRRRQDSAPVLDQEKPATRGGRRRHEE